jgi:hypothetical protein
MERRKNKLGLPLFCIFVFFAVASFFTAPRASAIDIFRPYGGRVIPRIGTICTGGEPAFDVKTTYGTVEGPFATTPLTRRYQYFSIWGSPLRNILLLAFPYQAPTCVKPCDEDPTTPCPFTAYSVYSFGISLIP